MTNNDWFAKIDELSYEDCLRLVRFAPTGHPYFQNGIVADYFNAHMNEKRASLTAEEVVAISKKIGWD